MTPRELRFAALAAFSFMATFLAFGFTFFMTHGSSRGLSLMAGIAAVGLSLTAIGVNGLMYAEKEPGKLGKPPRESPDDDP